MNAHLANDDQSIRNSGRKALSNGVALRQSLANELRLATEAIEEHERVNGVAVSLEKLRRQVWLGSLKTTGQR